MRMKRDNGRFLKGVSYSVETQFKKGQHWREKKPYWDKDWLINQYLTLKKSSQQIASEQGCGDHNIQYFLKKHKIPTRSVSEVRKIQHWGSIGADNPMFNRKGELSPNWKGGISLERQAFYSSSEWKSVCRLVWKRDNYSCKRCLIKSDQGVPFHIHHIVSFKNKELRSDPKNLLLMCEVCHHWIHSKKNVDGKYVEQKKVEL
jgi:mannose-6-phosphate isomerase-like protein (cupin superfamily)